MQYSYIQRRWIMEMCDKFTNSTLMHVYIEMQFQVRKHHIHTRTVHMLASSLCLIVFESCAVFSGMVALSNRGHCGCIFISRESSRHVYTQAANREGCD